MEVVNIKKAHLKRNGYKDFTEWDSNDNTLYIGRDMTYYVPGTVKSKWSNPYSARKYGREKCLELYEEYVVCEQNLLDSLHELDGKILGCWCKPAACHGDVLVKLVEFTRVNDDKKN